MEVPDHNGVGYSRGPQGEVYRSRGQLQRHHTIQTCDDAYVSQTLLLCLVWVLVGFCFVFYIYINFQLGKIKTIQC